ncbi:hypothetical protein niasHT_022755 [Heterodera trifolii]|uniref:S1-like domain-containing protein n=1 Tax=Heterodera trifolii TaxID=157864 RepID=A0ABD2K670_9BILA
MPKSKVKEDEKRGRGKNENDIMKRELVEKDGDDQAYAQVVKMLGNSRLIAFCFDGKNRLCHIRRGKLRKKGWINTGDIILTRLRGYQDHKGVVDVILKYTPDEARILKNSGQLPESTKLNVVDEGEMEFRLRRRREFAQTEEIGDGQVCGFATTVEASEIFISADCWLAVFDLLEPSQLGLGIALVSHRFDFYVDEHFKTRRWTLKSMKIWRKIGTNDTKGMQIVNYDRKPLPIPQKAMPKKIVGFEDISIGYFNQNAIAFLQRFRQLFGSCQINLVINRPSDRTFESFLCNIWPMIVKNICAMELYARIFYHLRQFVPSILNECPSLRVVNSNNSDGFFAEFPCDDSDNASNGQALAKWLFTPRPDNVPKVFKSWWESNYRNFSTRIEAFKSEFANASSPVNFIVVILSTSSFDDFVVPFDQTNELTREQLTLKWMNDAYLCKGVVWKDVGCSLLIRCPIVRDMDKWAKWEKEAIDWQFNGQWNRINIYRPVEFGRHLVLF